MHISDFQVIRPKFETSQSDTLDWIVDAHVQAESAKGLSEEELALFKNALREKLWHVGCKPDRVDKRGHVLGDYLHRNWKEMEIYQLDTFPQGKDLSFRSKIFGDHVDEVFESYYGEEVKAPDDLIHVSCTGYLSPSGAQKIVSKRNWGHMTTVTHAYHMGCYGSFPAIRMANGFIHSGKSQVDIVHTELCSLHMNPSLHQTDQLVTQSLFADGFIKYSVKNKASGDHFKVIALSEEIIPDSTFAMTWNVVDWGNQMYLAREVPVLIARHLPGYLERLFEKAKLPRETKALFAIHPGGPKILSQIQQLLSLEDSQITYSFEILKKYGNMSSATLPHIWEAILKNDQIPNNTPIVSMAFGPGLSISGSLMEKVCGP